MSIFLIVLPNPGVEDIMTEKVILTQPRPWCKEPICEQETNTSVILQGSVNACGNFQILDTSEGRHST